MVKQRKITKKDWKTVEEFVKSELKSRETSEFRKKHEEQWREVDRQKVMDPLTLVSTGGQAIEPTWESTLELGELSKVAEVVSADVMRIIFPAERDWFDPHVELDPIMDEQGNPLPPEPLQTIADDTYRALFAQQHMDFGFDGRFELSIKESLFHGSFVAEADWYDEMQVMDGTKVKHLGSPVWIPHSMWNCYPDPSPRAVAPSMFYTGSMIIRSYMPRWKLEMQKSEGWMPGRYTEVPHEEHNTNDVGPKNQTKDVEIITYYGDAVIQRKSSDDIYLPNSRIVLANGVLVYWSPNKLPYPSIIYSGYEKQDVRDPYFTSPIIKLAAWGKMGSIMANEFISGVKLRNKPPIIYDEMDPNFAMNGGPQIFPGASHGTKGGADFKQVEIGDPSAALSALELCIRVLQGGTGVNEVRQGAPTNDRKTAFEVNKIAQGAEVRTVDFIRKLNYALRSWLYMQHALNLKMLKEYTFYSDNMDTKDFVRISGAQYKETPVIHFDVVGAKGILGEEQRMERQTQVTAFASQNPMFAPLLKPRELLLNMYKDAGTKNPDRFVNAQGDMEDPQVAQLQQLVQALQAELQQAQDDNQVKVAEIERKREESLAKLMQAQEAKQMDVEQKEKDRIAEYTMHIENLKAEFAQNFSDAVKDIQHKIELFKAQQSAPISVVQTKDASLDGELKGLASQMNEVKEIASRKKKYNIKFTDDDNAVLEEEGDN